MEQAGFKVYGYRWIVLLAFMFVVTINQLLWITFAPITSTAAEYYGVSDLSIGLLSMSFMIVYIIISIPASWVIDTYGIRIAVGIGAVLTGVFGLLRGLVAEDYTLVLVSQIGIAIGQPFILNATTKVAARWFPIQERATASGLGTLAIYIGIILGLALTPYLTLHSGISSMLVNYGIVSVVFAVVFFLLAREHPPTSPCRPDQEERTLVFDGLKKILRKKNFIFLMLIFFVGLGVFNGVTTWIEDIVRPRGFSITQAGIIGGLMIGGGIIGAVIIPALSDHYRKRIPFIVLALAGSILGLIGVTYATSYWLILTSSFIFGLFLLSAGPVGFQYGAEIAFPAPEGTSNGLLLLMGQISGIVFIFGMDSFKSPDTGSMTLPLVVLIGLMCLGLLLCIRLKESTLITESAKR
ncbi:MAG: sugar phosphate permease [Ignavibacteria bacterium RBG_13_36_8]|nr:MAG: sugar phosphate permease [Ignavibacteria bacterium RBG_13_36_8]